MKEERACLFSLYCHPNKFVQVHNKEYFRFQEQTVTEKSAQVEQSTQSRRHIFVSTVQLNTNDSIL